MITNREFKKLANLRFSEAKILLENRSFSGSYYLAGYAVECGLKAIICLQFNENALPEKKFVQDIYSHKIASLASLAGLTPELNERLEADTEFEFNWALVSQWTEQSRYEFTRVRTH